MPWVLASIWKAWFKSIQIQLPSTGIYVVCRQVVSECGKLEMCLANAYVDHEARVEANVLAGLQQVCDVDVPNIMKHKRNLAKLILDMDSARTRWVTS